MQRMFRSWPHLALYVQIGVPWDVLSNSDNSGVLPGTRLCVLPLQPRPCWLCRCLRTRSDTSTTTITPSSSPNTDTSILQVYIEANAAMLALRAH